MSKIMCQKFVKIGFGQCIYKGLMDIQTTGTGCLRSDAIAAYGILID